MLSAWLRVVRIRFMLASVLAAAAGLAAAWWEGAQIDALHAALTMAGVVALHASVDLLNDYWDFKRGIDKVTRRTGMSGGTGVLPEGLLRPGQVYCAGVASLAAGAAAGSYFVLVSGPVIAVLLAFAVVSIYFYSTRIVDSGLAEVFVGIKGACIVLGTYYIQAGDVSGSAALAGAAIGILSATVLLVTSFPDHDADKSKGRKTLVISLGRRRAARLYWAFPALSLGIILASVAAGILPAMTLMALLAAPLALRAGIRLQGYDEMGRMVPAMKDAIRFSRVAGALLVAGFLVPW